MSHPKRGRDNLTYTPLIGRGKKFDMYNRVADFLAVGREIHAAACRNIQTLDLQYDDLRRNHTSEVDTFCRAEVHPDPVA